MCNLLGIFQQVCYTAAGTVVGGVVFGPLGAAVGGAVGKCCQLTVMRSEHAPCHNITSIHCTLKAKTSNISIISNTSQ